MREMGGKFFESTLFLKIWHFETPFCQIDKNILEQPLPKNRTIAGNPYYQRGIWKFLKPYYCGDRTMWNRTMRGLPVVKYSSCNLVTPNCLVNSFLSAGVTFWMVPMIPGSHEVGVTIWVEQFQLFDLLWVCVVMRQPFFHQVTKYTEVGCPPKINFGYIPAAACYYATATYW